MITKRNPGRAGCHLAALMMVWFLALPLAAANVGVGQVYFTLGGTDTQSNFSLNSDFNAALVAFIATATKSVRMAVYTFSDDNPAGNSILDALIARKNAGVTVKVVLDKDSTQGNYLATYNALKAAIGASNIQVENPVSDAEMHNKFIVIDADPGDYASGKVALGSANFTDPAFSSQNNNFLIIDKSPALAYNYTLEFEQMFTAIKFHQAKTDVKAASSFTVDSGAITIENYFNPYDDNIAKMVTKVNGAATRIYAAVYTFGSSALADAFIAAGLRNVKVKILFDKSQTLNNSSMNNLYNQLQGKTNIEIYLSTKNNYDIMHHKFMVVDNTVITGSANFTVSADAENDENDVMVTGDAVLTNQFILEFARIFPGYVDVSQITVPTTPTVDEAKLAVSAPVNWPNPYVWSPGQKITVATINRDILKELEIFDLRGRLIKRITLPGSASDRSIEWDGRDEHGKTVAAGSYQYQLYVKNVSKPLEGKLTLIK